MLSGVGNHQAVSKNCKGWNTIENRATMGDSIDAAGASDGSGPDLMEAAADATLEAGARLRC